MQILLSLLVALVGAGTVVQTAMNSQLRASLGHTVLGAAVNFSVGLGVLGLMIMLLRIPLPSAQAVGAVPLWAWCGGALGASFVAVVAYAGRDLGALVVVGAVVVGQVLASLLIDHYGWLGFPERPFTTARFLGCVLLLGGFLLLKRG
jgi:transporter family-2 protein